MFVLSYCYLSSLISQVKTNTPNQVVRRCNKSGENAEDLMDEIRRLYMNNQLLMQEIEELKTQLLKITLKYQIQKRKQENFKEQNNVIREIAIVKPLNKSQAQRAKQPNEQNYEMSLNEWVGGRK